MHYFMKLDSCRNGTHMAQRLARLDHADPRPPLYATFQMVGGLLYYAAEMRESHIFQR